ncbi:MAG: class I SAM-dependent methyltransferase [Syntrophales bacterium]
MTPASGNRFEEFFADDAYVVLKNFLYNYLLRKRAVGICLRGVGEGPTLEIGSGLSPTVDHAEGVVFSELSFAALRTLKNRRGGGMYVVADATRLPFKPDSFTRIVCSEVLEHIPDDRPAFGEMAAALRTGGSLVLTFPHRRGYFACDDRFVHHYRRYELSEMEDRLRGAGLIPIEIGKILGPLEKVTMILVTAAIAAFGRTGTGRRPAPAGGAGERFIRRAFILLNRLYCLPVWLDARLAPRPLSAVLLIRAVKPAQRSG